MYLKYKNLIKEEHYFNPHGIHGIKHIHRVLYLINEIMKDVDLSEREKEMVAIAAVYHDIGRVNDYEDATHGKMSCEKIKKLGLLENFKLTEEEKNTICKLIEFHCIDDDYFCGNDIEKLQYQVLKDGDALDRVRILDLNPYYLRLEKSKLLVPLAIKILLSSVDEVE